VPIDDVACVDHVVVLGEATFGLKGEFDRGQEEAKQRSISRWPDDLYDPIRGKSELPPPNACFTTHFSKPLKTARHRGISPKLLLAALAQPRNGAARGRAL
jgi:hypothetical protein